MFERFGEFDSAREINELAENLFNENDIDSLKVLAKENGIPEEFVIAYIEGDIPELCDAGTAAIGKLEIEAEKLEPKEIMADWLEYIRCQVMEDDILGFRVRKKGKSLEGCIAYMLQWSYKHQIDIPERIRKEAGMSGRVTIGIPGMERAHELIREYYLR